MIMATVMTIAPIIPNIPHIVQLRCLTSIISLSFCLMTVRSTGFKLLILILLALSLNYCVVVPMISDSFRVIGKIRASAAISKNSSALHSCLRIETEQSILAGRVIFVRPLTG